MPIQIPFEHGVIAAGSGGLIREGKPMFHDADAAIAKVEEDVQRAQTRAERLPLLQAK